MRVVEGISNTMIHIDIFILHQLTENICLVQERMLKLLSLKDVCFNSIFLSFSLVETMIRSDTVLVTVFKN